MTGNWFTFLFFFFLFFIFKGHRCSICLQPARSPTDSFSFIPGYVIFALAELWSTAIVNRPCVYLLVINTLPCIDAASGTWWNISCDIGRYFDEYWTLFVCFTPLDTASSLTFGRLLATQVIVTCPSSLSSPALFQSIANVKTKPLYKAQHSWLIKVSWLRAR